MAKIVLNEKGKIFLQAVKGFLIPNHYAFACFVQAYHETGAFKSIIGKWNLWGIKKSQKWTGDIVLVKTTEFINGVKTPTTAWFVDFPTCQDAIKWWDALIQRLYKDAYDSRADYKKFFEHLVDRQPDYAGDPDFQYATDPLYVTKLLRVANELKGLYLSGQGG